MIDTLNDSHANGGTMYTKHDRAKIDAALGTLDYDVLVAQKVLEVLRDGDTSFDDARTVLAHAMVLLHGAEDWDDLVRVGVLPAKRE